MRKMATPARMRTESRSASPRPPWRRGVGIVVLGILAGAPSLAANGGLDDPVTTVNQFRGALQDGNVAQVQALLAPDVLIYEAGEEQVSRDDYVAHHLKADIAQLATVYVDTLSQTAHADERSAWVTTRSRWVAREADPQPPATVTETVALRRFPQGWRIVHIHWSVSP